MSLVAEKDYTDAASMRAAYARIRRQFNRPQVKLVVKPPPAPEPAPVKPVDPLAQYRLAYDSAIDKKNPTQVAKRIMRETAEEHGVTVEQMVSNGRFKPLVYPRQLAMWRIVKDTKLSLPRIGFMFKRDHTTVMHAVRKFNEIMDEDVRGMGVVRGAKILSWQKAKEAARRSSEASQ